MKVLHILYELKPSGAEVMLKCAAPFWSRHGYECDILATGPTVGAYAEVLQSAGYRIHHLPNSRDLRYLPMLWRFVRTGSYDIVHQHAEGMSFWLGLTSLLAGAKVLRTVHNNFHFTGNLRLRRGAQRRLLAGLGVRYVAIGESVAQNEWDRFGLATTRIPNWVDLENLAPATDEQRQFARARWGFNEGDCVALTLGNCSTVKNHTSLLEALSMCRDLTNLRYLHVGMEDGVQSERTLVHHLGLQDRVVFAGWMENPREALHAADIFVMPSLYEGFSIAALEALCTQLPSVLANVPGLRDLRSTFPGLFYAAPTPEGISTSIRAVTSLDSSSRREITATYRKIAQDHFSAELGVRRYATIYDCLCPPESVEGARC